VPTLKTSTWVIIGGVAVIAGLLVYVGSTVSSASDAVTAQTGTLGSNIGNGVGTGATILGAGGALALLALVLL
jgi:hypothetical protein